MYINKSIKCKVCILDSVFINNSLVRINNFGNCIKIIVLNSNMVSR